MLWALENDSSSCSSSTSESENWFFPRCHITTPCTHYSKIAAGADTDIKFCTMRLGWLRAFLMILICSFLTVKMSNSIKSALKLLEFKYCNALLQVGWKPLIMQTQRRTSWTIQWGFLYFSELMSSLLKLRRATWTYCTHKW